MLDKEKEANAWLAFASAAIAGYTPPENDMEFEHNIEEIVETALAVADEMIEEFDARYGSGKKKPAKKTRGRRHIEVVKEEDEEEEEEDEEDDDE